MPNRHQRVIAVGLRERLAKPDEGNAGPTARFSAVFVAGLLARAVACTPVSD
jgi:hypothetical protein